MRFRFLRLISAVFIAHVIVITAYGAEHPGINSRAAQFRVDSELVGLPLSIVDRMGRTVVGLAAGDFVVAENGVVQQVLAVSRWDAPASIGAIFDTSGSMKVDMRTAQAAVRVLLHE